MIVRLGTARCTGTTGLLASHPNSPHTRLASRSLPKEWINLAACESDRWVLATHGEEW
jgi:hypothetical protein